jgi:hypothetical protein
MVTFEDHILPLPCSSISKCCFSIELHLFLSSSFPPAQTGFHLPFFSSICCLVPFFVPTFCILRSYFVYIFIYYIFLFFIFLFYVFILYFVFLYFYLYSCIFIFFYIPAFLYFYLYSCIFMFLFI